MEERIPLTFKALQEKIERGEDNFKNYSFVGAESSDIKLLESKRIIFLNCSFITDVAFTIEDGIEQISFSNCTFNAVNLRDNNEHEKNYPLKISFSNCEMAGAYISIVSPHRQLNLSYIECKSKYLTLVDTKITLLRIIKSNIESFHISGCFFNESDENTMLWLGLNSGLEIKHETVIKSLLISRTILTDLSIMDSTIEENGIIESSKIISLSLKNIQCEGYFAIILQGNVKINSGKIISGLYIQNSKFKNGLTVFSNLDSDLFEEKPVLPLLDLSFNSLSSGHITIQNIDIINIEISGINNAANLSFKNITIISTFRISSFINLGNTTFISVNSKANEQTKLHILDSILGELYLLDSNLSNFKAFDIRRTDITKTRFINSTLINFNRSLNQLGSKDLGNIARQLKQAMENQSDRIKALEFHKWEMHFYQKELTEKRHESIWYDRAILWLGNTNEFGLNPWKAVKWGVVCTLLMYIPISLIGSNQLSLALPEYPAHVSLTFATFFNQLGVYPQLLNPAHSLSQIYGADKIQNISGAIHFFDFLHRIITAFFIFQVVSAFRKYVRSSA